MNKLSRKFYALQHSNCKREYVVFCPDRESRAFDTYDAAVAYCSELAAAAHGEFLYQICTFYHEDKKNKP